MTGCSILTFLNVVFSCRIKLFCHCIFTHTHSQLQLYLSHITKCVPDVRVCLLNMLLQACEAWAPFYWIVTIKAFLVFVYSSCVFIIFVAISYIKVMFASPNGILKPGKRLNLIYVGKKKSCNGHFQQQGAASALVNIFPPWLRNIFLIPKEEVDLLQMLHSGKENLKT